MGVGQLVKGKWLEEKKVKDKKHNRQFREKIYDDKHAVYPAKSNRYHLYTTFGNPWSHRVMIALKLKGLEEAIGLSVVDPVVSAKAQGWTFTDYLGCTSDPVMQATYLHELYTRSDDQFTGRVSVPMLWDKKSNTVVNNESADMMRMLNSEFNQLAVYPGIDLYPFEHRAAIDHWNDRILQDINNCVYWCGLAQTQADYAEAYHRLFITLDEIDSILVNRHYLIADRPLETDWKLFSILIRFDAVYYILFRCNKRKISAYSGISDYMHRLYHYPGIAETVDFTHIKRSYFLGEKFLINPSIVSMGPERPF